MDWTDFVKHALPIFIVLIVFGMPVLLVWVLRETGLRRREIDLAHDKRVAELQRERDVLDAKLALMEPELEFLRSLVRGGEVRARVATDAPAAALPPAKTVPAADEYVDETVRENAANLLPARSEPR